MPALQITVPGVLPRAHADSSRRQVTITSPVGTTTLPITSPEADHENLAPRFAQVDRWDPAGWSKPFLRRTNTQLRTMRLTAHLVAYEPATSVDDLILVLTGHAETGPCVVAYGALEGGSAVFSGRWYITDLTIRTERREPVTNNVTQALATIVFTEAGPEPRRPSLVATATGGTSASPPSSVAPAPVPVPESPSPRRHTVRAGETLWALAVLYYHDGNRWTAIATANGVRDPRRLAIGAELTIP